MEEPGFRLGRWGQGHWDRAVMPTEKTVQRYQQRVYGREMLETGQGDASRQLSSARQLGKGREEGAQENRAEVPSMGHLYSTWGSVKCTKIFPKCT